MVSQKPSILIVDDEPVVCELLCEELGERGYLCATAESGSDALTRLKAEDFEVVLLDIRLPGVSGMEVLREIRLNPNGLAAIMITAVNDVDTAVEAMKLGAADYVVKPFDMDRVEASIRAALETKPATGKASARIDAIARGIEAKLDPLSSYAKVVTQQTAVFARQLGIPEKEIQEWAATKEIFDSRMERAVKSVGRT